MWPDASTVGAGAMSSLDGTAVGSTADVYPLTFRANECPPYWRRSIRSAYRHVFHRTILVGQLPRASLVCQSVAVVKLASAARSAAATAWTSTGSTSVTASPNETAIWKPLAGFGSTEWRTCDTMIHGKHFRL